MAVVVACPKCSTGLRVPDGSVAAVRCPKCATVFQPPAVKPAAPAPRPPAPARPAARPAPAAEFEVVNDAPPKSPPPPPTQKKAFSLDDAVRSAGTRPRRDDRDDRDEDDDRDRERRRRRDDDYDADDRPRGRSRRDRDDDDDYDRRDRRRRDDDYDDDDDYDRDRPRKGSKYGLARPAVLLMLISVALYLGGLALHALFVFINWVGGDIPYGLTALTGVIGLAGWVVGLVGFGLAIAGPPRARGLAIAVTAVAFVHLVLAVVVAYNSRAAEFGGTAIRWQDLVTDLPRLDQLIAALVYNSRGFDNYVLPLLAGMAELARLILLGLLLGSLARVAKVHKAVGLAKFGWIAAPSAVGIAMLVVLLAAVMAESTVKDAMRGPNLPTGPQYTSGGDFRDFQRQMEERNRQMQDEMQRFRQRQESLGRTLRVWANGGELLVYLLHGGTLILPLMASFGVYQAMGRRR